MTKQSDLEQIAKTVALEIPRDAALIAAKLFPVVPPGYEQMSEPDYLSLVKRNWLNPQFRQGLLRRVGPKNFLATAKRATQPQEPEIANPEPAGPTDEAARWW